jgi:Family of unknown function (DUF6527)
MGVKVHKYEGSDSWLFHCPGCGYDHPFRVGGDVARPQWTFNGSLEAPTFSPSLVVFKGSDKQCHSIVTDGRIQFCGDSFHDLKNQTVDLPDWEDFTRPQAAQESEDLKA